MSFRFNLSQNISDRSIIAQGNELFATSIGRTGNGTTLSCCLNVDNKNYRYGKTEEQIIGALLLVEKKLKRQAFRAIQKYTHYHKQTSSSVFLPEALSQGNYGAMSKFLGSLRTNRVNAYIKLNMQESKGHFHKASTLLKPVTAIVKQRVQYGFVRLRNNMLEKRKMDKEKILIDIEKISSIQNKNSQCSELNPSPQTKLINLTFVPIRVSASKISQISHRKSSFTCRQFSTTKKSSYSKNSVSTYIDVSDLIDERRIREYQFKHITTVKQGMRTTYSRHI